MNADLVFVDTNVLIYARDASEPTKQPLALHWLDALWTTRRGRLSVQVLNEYYVTLTRKLKPGLSIKEAREDVRSLFAWDPLPMDGAVIDGAFTTQDRYGLPYWDALIVTAAQLSGAGYLLSEDLQDGQDLDGLRVVNPFLQKPEGLLGTEA